MPKKKNKEKSRKGTETVVGVTSSDPHNSTLKNDIPSSSSNIYDPDNAIEIIQEWITEHQDQFSTEPSSDLENGMIQLQSSVSHFYQQQHE